MHVECSKCGRVLTIGFGGTYTLVCQICGSKEGTIHSENMKAIEVHCVNCRKEYLIATNRKVQLNCVKCGLVILRVAGEGILSSVLSEEIKIPGYLNQEKLIEVGKQNAKLKITIPYYRNPLVDRSIMSWIYPEVVFFLTDPGIIPPGFGVCNQIFSEENGLSKGSKTRKPFLRDVLDKTYQTFPDEDYYGYFNSDIILPPGKSVYDLLPRGGKIIAVHHRLNMNGVQTDPIRNLKKFNQEISGKDGFIISKSVLQKVIREFGNPLLGSPGWDDSILRYFVEKYGEEKVDIRFGEIWHPVHAQRWNYNQQDAIYNFKALDRKPNHTMVFDSSPYWEVEKKTQDRYKRRKRLGFVQPGRVGDLLVILPIARKYFNEGWSIHWPIPKEFIATLDCAPYIKTIDLGSPGDSYHASHDILGKEKVDRVLDFGVGFGRPEKEWIDSGLNFNEWKYTYAGVPFEERKNLIYNRDFEKELTLKNIIFRQFGINGEKYCVTHHSSSWNTYEWAKDIHNYEKKIVISHIPGYTVLDWVGIMEQADHLYFVDSCFVAIADQLNLCVNRRTVRYWPDYRNSNKTRERLTMLKISDDWEKVWTGVKYS